MKRLVSTVAFAVAVAALVPTAASAYVRSVQVENNSTNCAWITVYRLGTSWDILADAANRPREIKPGAKYTFTLANRGVKVMAETMHTARCDTSHGPTLTKQFEGEIELAYHKIAVLSGSSASGFQLHFVR